MGFSDYRRAIGISAALSALIVAGINLAQGDYAKGAIVLVLAVALLGGVLWWTSPGRGGPHVDHAAAQAAAGDDDVIVYWRPG